jgi:SAM-dependent methyltransferase
MNRKVQYICPECGSGVHEEGGAYVCTSHGHRWAIRDGVPCFTRKEIYWNDIPAGEMRRMIDVGAERGWRTVYYDHLRRRYPKAELGIIGDERRADWMFLADVDENSACLDIGTGWGAVSIGLAGRCGEVHAIDATWERLRMMVLRRDQENISNLHPVYGGAELGFPFPPGSFNLVSLVGVLEWIPQWKRDLPPEECQLAALRSVRDMLKPGGQVYVAIENRTGYNYIMGRRDHNNVRFVSLMPRFAADLVSRAVTGSGYRTYQYTWLGYEKLLKRAGFEDVEFYITVPNYRDPYLYVPLDDPAAQEYFLRELFDTFTLISPERKKEYKVEYLAARAALKIGRALPLAAMLKWITPGFGMLARKPK